MFRPEKNFLSRDPPSPQNSKKLLWLCGRRYASCVHAGGLSCLNFILPFTLLLIMNAVIINTLSRRSRSIKRTRGHGQSQGKSEGQADDHSQRTKNSETQISVMLLFVTFSYLLLNSPTYIYIFLVVAEVKKQTPYDIALFHLIFSVGQKALYTNYGINFFLYVISGEKFRTNLLSLLKGIVCFKT